MDFRRIVFVTLAVVLLIVISVLLFREKHKPSPDRSVPMPDPSSRSGASGTASPFGGRFQSPPPPAWLRTLAAKAEGIPGRPGEIARLLVSDDAVDLVYGVSLRAAKDRRKILAGFGWHDDMDVGEMLRPDGELYQAVAALIGEEGAAFAGRLWRRKLGYALPLSRDETPPAMMRTRKLGSLRVLDLMEGLREVLFTFSAKGGPRQRLEEVFSGDYRRTRPPEEVAISFPFVGQCIVDDAGGRFLERFTSMLRRDRDSGGAVSVMGAAAFLFASGNPEALTVLAEMAADPGLNEDQRESIFDLSQTYGVEGSIAILKALAKAPEGVRSGAAVKKVLYGSLLLDPEPVEKRGAPDFLTLMASCLTDPAEREAAFSGSEEDVYVALWALSRLEMADCFARACELIRSGTDLQKSVALFFMANQFRVSQYQWLAARPVLASPGSWKGTRDSGHLVLALHCLDDFSGSAFFKARGFYTGGSVSGWPRLVGDSGGEPLFTETRDLFLTRDELFELYANLKRIITHMQDAGKDGGAFGGTVPLGQSDWGGLSLNRTFAPMINLARREVVETRPALLGQPREPGEWERIAKRWGFEWRPLPTGFMESKRDRLDENADPLNIRDDLCAYLDDMTNYDDGARGELLGKVVTDGSHSPAQRRAFMRMFPEAMHYAARVAFTDHEYGELEKVLASASPRIRVRMFPLFLKRDPAGLGLSLKRLLAAPNATAGQELLAIVARRKDDPAYSGIYGECAALAGGEGGAHAKMARAHAADDANGYGGLYDGAAPPAQFPLPPAPDTDGEDAGRTVFGVARDEVLALARAVGKVIDANASLSYQAEPWGGGGEPITITLGGESGIMPEHHPERNREAQNRLIPAPRFGRTHLDDYPIPGAWRTMLAGLRPSAACLVFYGCSSNPNALSFYPNVDVPWWKYGRGIIVELRNRENEFSKHQVYDGGLREGLMNEAPPDERYPLLRAIVQALMTLDPNSPKLDMSLAAMLSYVSMSVLDNDVNFAEYFRILYSYRFRPDALDVRMAYPWPHEFARAHRLGVLPENDFVRFFVAWARSNPRWFEVFVNPATRDELLAAAPGLDKIVDRIKTVAMDLEKKRGAVPTRLSKVAEVLKKYDPASRAPLPPGLRP